MRFRRTPNRRTKSEARRTGSVLTSVKHERRDLQRWPGAALEGRLGPEACSMCIYTVISGGKVIDAKVDSTRQLVAVGSRHPGSHGAWQAARASLGSGLTAAA